MWEKVQEELAEFQEEVQHADKEKMSDEFGDILFALVNIARFYKIDSEAALAKTNTKFLNRFQYIEEKVRASEKPFESFSLEELDEFWEEAKKTGL
jgi:tetrapyrrole methylase family protein/MazG family protein